MSRIFISWELGANFGHLTRLMPIAEQLRHKHELFFAVRDTEVAAALLEPQGFLFTQAPFWHGRACLSAPPINYAELLIAEGYCQQDGLSGMLRSWLSLFRIFQPDVVVADYSPTALLAAHIAKIPAVCIDNGFGLPPNIAPLPSIRSWESITEQRLQHAEEKVLCSINSVCRAFGGPALERLADLFNIEGTVLTTFAELDHYGRRNETEYAGPIFSNAGGQAMHWQNTHRRKVIAYLRPSVPGIDNLLKTLAELDAEVICVVPGLKRLNRAIANRLRIYVKPVQLDNIILSADLMVSYAGSGTVCCALLAGVPLLLVPQNVEQYVFSCRVDELGAGLVMGTNRSEADFRISLQQLLDEGRFRAAAKAFASRHSGFHPEQAVSFAVRVIETVIYTYRTSQFGAFVPSPAGEG
ncbi:nucleotide disphospho-sugar-binding domain-containing protein [Methylobacter sp.]|uniref:glycosyltransferase n=1 Tax=Methylobacter sp. TaxID=2051955 RepID=UPI00248778C9|nr:nucleotide disphospho-sugar-binding domain-containing protein [Methylobacter sp.]MDI1278936.1 glycosyltransferase [Methylobacter sp.]MDI1360123.1 glycosyltransferase [Methylobacter sp.]